MLNKVYNKFFQKNEKVNLPSLLAQLNQIRTGSDSLVLYGSPTGANWLGIANATRSLFPSSGLEIPQWYSNPVLNEKETVEVCREISRLKFSKVIISGFAPYFFNWMDALHARTEIETLFHGTFSEFHEPGKRELMEKLISRAQKKEIKRMGFVKRGMAEVMAELFNLETQFYPLPSPALAGSKSPLNLNQSAIHIGVFGSDSFNKNLHNQVAAALLVPNAQVHVLDDGPFQYLNLSKRITGHGTQLNRETFLNLLGSMHINLYLSFSESWGLIATESEALGVPCIVSSGSSVSGHLIYKMGETDRPELIKEKIMSVLNSSLSISI